MKFAIRQARVYKPYDNPKLYMSSFKTLADYFHTPYRFAALAMGLHWSFHTLIHHSFDT